jgi:Ras-related protein Rab-1A
VLLKVVIVGDSAVGKSSLLVRFADQMFTESRKGTLGVDFRFRTVISSKRVVKLQIWDTAGQERFRTMTSTFYRGASGFIVCFDVSDRGSFQSIESWIADVKVRNIT